MPAGQRNTQPPLQTRRPTGKPTRQEPAALRGRAPAASLDRDLGGVGCLEAVVAGPAERERAAFGGGREERQERVGRDRRRQFGAKHPSRQAGSASNAASSFSDTRRSG